LIVQLKLSRRNFDCSEVPTILQVVDESSEDLIDRSFIKTVNLAQLGIFPISKILLSNTH
jgi:hypothetical protein